VVGILVHGGNHFIVEGPEPDGREAIELARHWSLIRIGAKTPPDLEGWRIVTRAFREDLAWAIVVGDTQEISTAVVQLLDELRGRGIVVRETSGQL
jgi:hypothetical protein